MLYITKKWVITVFSALFLFVGVDARASIVINTTRVILHQADNAAVTRLSNKGEVPLLVQAWIDAGDANANPSTSQVPFAVTPPVARVDPGSSQAIRILAVNPNLPSDRESLFWLNVMEIPPTPAASGGERKNFIQVAVRTRIKLFYRPASLTMSPGEAYQGLTFALQPAVGAYRLVIKNPSPYFITFNQLVLQLSEQENVVVPFSSQDSRMIAPLAEVTLPISALKKVPPATARISFVVVNDTGGITRQETALIQGNGAN